MSSDSSRAGRTLRAGAQVEATEQAGEQAEQVGQVWWRTPLDLSTSSLLFPRLPRPFQAEAGRYVARAIGGLALVASVLGGLSSTRGLAAGTDGGSFETAAAALEQADALSQRRAGGEDSPSIYASWNQRLATHPEPVLLLLAGTGETHAASSWFSPWMALGVGVVVGGGIAFFLGRRLAKPRPGKASGAPLGGGPIELLASSTLNDDGSVLVVDVMGEQLVLGVSGRRDFVTLLTRVGDPRDVEQLDPSSLQALIQARRQDALSEPGQRAGGRSEKGRGASYASAPAASPWGGSDAGDAGRGATSTAARSLMPPPMDEEHSQDEDLEELLDELLGKVRGLKPLAKHPDEP